MVWASFFVPLIFSSTSMKSNIVLKVGGSVLFTKRGRLDLFRIRRITGEIKTLQSSGYGVVLVVSGAVACGAMYKLFDLKKTHERMAAAGMGQIDLVAAIRDVCREQSVHTAQLLLSVDTLRYKNRIKSLQQVLHIYAQKNIVAVCNENDVIGLNQFGGNDCLAVKLALAVSASHTLILSTMAGSLHGVGGGETKRAAVSTLTQCGIKTSIVNGKEASVITRNIPTR